jgi:hypothetical protein
MMRGSCRTRDKDLGVIQVLLNRLNTFRMPQALKLKQKVDGGERLSEHDIQLLKRALSEGGEARRLAAKHPKYQSVVDEMTPLYAEILRKGVDNEQAGTAGGKKSQTDHQ